jgi:CHASE2 domain-containing sensor protein
MAGLDLFSRHHVSEGIELTADYLYLRKPHGSDGRMAAMLETVTSALPPAIALGIVAQLYKSRRDVEKVFDEFKNKLGEIKS